MAWVISVQKAIGTIVDAHSHYTHIVSVENSAVPIQMKSTKVQTLRAYHSHELVIILVHVYTILYYTKIEELYSRIHVILLVEENSTYAIF